MCFGSSRDSEYAEGEIEAYRIHRMDDSPSGHHDRSRRSVERHLANAPDPVKRGKRYPKKHDNIEGQFDAQGQLWEYPTKDYPYASQNAKGKAHRTSPGGTEYQVEPEYTRTITDDRKVIQGVVYHPYNDPRRHVRAEEIIHHGSSSRRRRRR